jgi:hypothetical protein
MRNEIQSIHFPVAVPSGPGLLDDSSVYAERDSFRHALERKLVSPQVIVQECRAQ